jgi:hypothetical protein
MEHKLFNLFLGGEGAGGNSGSQPTSKGALRDCPAALNAAGKETEIPFLSKVL